MKTTWRISVASTVLLLTGAVGVQAQQRHEHQGQQHARPAQPQPAQPARTPPPAAQQRLQEAQQRHAAYQAALQRQVAASQERQGRLQQEQRQAQIRAQQQYLANLRAEQQRIQNERREEYAPRVLATPAYRYRRAGAYYQTNEYGAQTLRRAVQLGYQEGYRAGRADRDDRARFDYADSYAYQDANYGFGGLYVGQADYSYYFREGFRRGYEDGYYTRYRYGSLVGGAPSILGGVLTSILGLVTLH